MTRYQNENGFTDSRVEPGYFEDPRQDLESIKDEIRSTARNMLEEICGEVESELSLIDIDNFRDLDVDRIWSLFLGGVHLAKSLKGLQESWESLDNEVALMEQPYD